MSKLYVAHSKEEITSTLLPSKVYKHISKLEKILAPKKFYTFTYHSIALA